MKEWGAGRDSADWRRILRRAEIDRDRGLELIIRRSLVRVQAGPFDTARLSGFRTVEPNGYAGKAAKSHVGHTPVTRRASARNVVELDVDAA
jgi:hypothetical protein